MTAHDAMNPVQFYHGTSPEDADSIQRGGLTAERFTRGYPVLTTSKQFATEFAGSRGHVVGVSIPGDQVDNYVHPAVPHSPDYPGEEMRGLKQRLPASMISGAAAARVEDMSPAMQKISARAKARGLGGDW